MNERLTFAAMKTIMPCVDGANIRFSFLDNHHYRQVPASCNRAYCGLAILLITLYTGLELRRLRSDLLNPKFGNQKSALL